MSSMYDLNNISGFNELPSLANNSDKFKEKANSLKLKCNIWKEADKNYYILKYDKTVLCHDNYLKNGLVRSVIMDTDGNIKCFAPPKSLNNFKVEEGEEYVSEKFVEGTMINVFYDGEWKIATRSSIGGNLTFFMEEGFKESETFSSMFYDICSDLAFSLSSLNEKYVYSFVMQHPKNRIVKPITKKRLYLVEIFEINGLQITVCKKENLKETFGVSDKIKIPKSIPFNSEEQLVDLKETTASMNTPYDCMGAVIKDKNNVRYKLRNPNYENVRHLRGNQPKLQYQYLELRKSGKLKEYLQYYKEHRKLFEKFRDIMHEYTEALYNNYVSCYIKKEAELKTYPSKYRTHMYKLHHEIYLPSIAEKKIAITKQVVINYINELQSAHQMYVLNFDLRNNIKDLKISDEKIENNKERYSTRRGIPAPGRL